MITLWNVLQENKKMSNDPLHGKPLKEIVEQLVNFYGFDTLAELINIKCFKENPSVNSSLKFLRKTDWARKKIEELYVRTLSKF
nr:VF530 family protein [uncultured Flavobacterium sp.]